MELDELKTAWAKYDDKLTRSLRLNEELLKSINLNNAKRELEKPLRYEQFGVVSMFAMVIGLIVMTIRNGNELKYIVPGIISIIVAIVYFVFAAIKVRRFMSIDHFGGSIIKLQKDITRLNQLVLQLRKYELLMIPLVTISFPVIFKFLYNVDMYEKISSFWITVVVCLVFGIPATLWINRNVYDKKFQSATGFLKQLDDFELDRVA